VFVEAVVTSKNKFGKALLQKQQLGGIFKSQLVLFHVLDSG
jgi:hypothetical protein